MPFNRNDMILVDYVLKVKETNEVIETTIADKAKEYKIYNPSNTYEPLLVILGEGRVIKGFEEALEKAEVGVEAEVEVPPEKAYGVRDPSKVRTIPLRDFVRAGVRAEVGKVVEVGGQLGTIRSVSGGRVVVDFNHPLAGKTLVYQFKVIKKLEDDVEKVRYLVKRHVRGVNINDIKVNLEVDSGKLTIELPQSTYLSDNIQVAKKLVADDIFRYLSNISEVIYVERYWREGIK